MKHDGAEHGRHEQEEREPRRRVAVEAEEATGRDRDPRARDAGHERERLRDADGEAFLERELVASPRRRAPVGEPEHDPKTARKIAICHGSPRCVVITSSNGSPTIAAGIVAIRTIHASRSSVVSILRVRERAEPARARGGEVARRSTPPLRASVPRWSATSNVWLKSSLLPRGTSSRRATARGRGGRTTRSAGARSRPGRFPGRAPASCGKLRARPPPRRSSGAPRARAARRRARTRTAAHRGMVLAAAPAHSTIRRRSAPRRKRRNLRPLPARGRLTRGPPARRLAVHRARSATRSKPVTQALRASGRSTWQVDESATGSVNFFGPDPRGVRPADPRCD